MDATMNINQEKLNASIRYLNKVGDMRVESLREAAPEVSERLERLGELLKNEEFCNQFVTSESKEAAAKLFTDRGFDITDEELTALAAQIRKFTHSLIENGGELSEEDLEQVAGGASDFTWDDVGTTALAGAGIGAAIGTGVCPGFGTVMGVGFGAIAGMVAVGIGWAVTSISNWIFGG